jgi:hypothetical protein
LPVLRQIALLVPIAIERELIRVLRSVV